VSRSVSLDPELNLRLFPAGARASLHAIPSQSGGLVSQELGVWNALLDGIGPDEHAALVVPAAEAGVTAKWCFPWLRLGGHPLQLISLAAALHGTALERISAQLRAAVPAFATHLYEPPRTLVMGILNVTPDSFSDGGLWLNAEPAVEHALRMIDEGADILDIGGESSRPGAEEVDADEELRRVLPVIRRLRAETQALISVDTRKASVARACLEAGADWVNDVSGLTYDPEIADAVATFPDAKLVLMHSRARPEGEKFSTEYAPAEAPAYEDVVADTLRWLRVQAGAAIERGVSADQLWIDPGFGFGKTYEQNLELLRRLREYTSAGLPLLVGTSRKSTVGKLTGDLPIEERLEGTLATVAVAVAQGAAAVRVHDVKSTARVVRAADALR